MRLLKCIIAAHTIAQMFYLLQGVLRHESRVWFSSWFQVMNPPEERVALDESSLGERGAALLVCQY